MTARTARHGLALGVLLLLLLLLAGACGDDGGDSGSESFDAPDATTDEGTDEGTDETTSSSGAAACDLLTTEVVAELLGQAVTDGEEVASDDDTSLCEWFTEESSQVVDGPITLSVELGELTDEVQAEIQTALDDPANEVLDFGDAAVHVCGLGADGADCSSLDSVLVAVGDQYLEVDLGNWGYPGDFAEDEGVAITAAAAQMAADALG